MSEYAELLEQFRKGTEAVEEALYGATDEEINFRPAAGKWTAREIMCHLADTEATSVVRLRQIISEDNPTLVPWNQDAWAARTDYASRSLERALTTFRLLRDDNYRLLKAIPEDAWSRKGNHLERGPMSVIDFVRIFARHAHSHAKQIRDLRLASKK